MTTPQQPPTDWTTAPASGTPPTPAPGTPVKATGPSRAMLVALGVLCALLAISTAVFATLWVGERSDNSSTRPAIGSDTPHLFDTAEAVRADDEGVTWTGNGTSLTVDVDPYSDLAWMEEFVDVLGLPSAVIRRMENTRALDGTLEESQDGITVTWTYHPDDGLSAVFSVD